MISFFGGLVCVHRQTLGHNSSFLCHPDGLAYYCVRYKPLEPPLVCAPLCWKMIHYALKSGWQRSPSYLLSGGESEDWWRSLSIAEKRGQSKRFFLLSISMAEIRPDGGLDATLFIATQISVQEPFFWTDRIVNERAWRVTFSWFWGALCFDGSGLWR